jgi:hypothetical protein
MGIHQPGNRRWFHIGVGYLAPAIIGVIVIGWSQTGALLQGIESVFAPSNWGRSLFKLCAFIVAQFVGLRITDRFRKKE